MNAICSALTIDWNPWATLVGAAGGAAITVLATVKLARRKDAAERAHERAQVEVAVMQVTATLHDLHPEELPNAADGQRIRNVVTLVKPAIAKVSPVFDEALASARHMRLIERYAIRTLLVAFKKATDLSTMSVVMNDQMAERAIRHRFFALQELHTALGDVLAAFSSDANGQATARWRQWPPRLLKSRSHGTPPPQQ